MTRVRRQSLSGGRASRRGGARPERGSALVVVLLVIAALSYLSVMGARTARSELQITEMDVNAKQALSVAEAGLNHAYNLIKSSSNFSNELSSGGTGGTLTSIGSVVTLGGSSYRFHVFGGGSSDGYYVQAADDYDETSGANNSSVDMNARIYLVSRGRVGNAERVVTAAVSGNPKFPYGLFGDQSITLGGGAQTDSYDSRIAPYNAFTAGHAGNIRTNGAVTFNGSTNTVHGDATQTAASPAIGDTVTGTKTTGAAALTAPCAAPSACGPPYSANSGIVPSSAYSGPGTGDLTISGAVNLASGTYCFRTIKVTTTGSSLTVSGAVTINVTGDSGAGYAVNFTGGSLANPTGAPANLQINSSFNAPTADGIILTGNAQAYMAVYAPNTGVKITGGSGFWGAIWGAYVKNTGGTSVHYDQGLQSLVCTTGMKGWHEARN